MTTQFRERTRSRSSKSNTTSTETKNDNTKFVILGIGTIRYARELLSKHVEVCGNFSEINGSGGKKYLQVVTNVLGTNKQNRTTVKNSKTIRHSCQHKVYSKYIWHTHPTVAKSYPSSEDIIKVVKSRTSKEIINVSIIFTEWGIWVIRAVKKSQQLSQYLKAKLKEPGNIIYNITKSSKNIAPLKHIKCYISNVEAIVEAECNAKIKIKFHKWGGRGIRVYY